jgi:23S rRNA (cytosine1962-C5)-methyltransferase
MITPMKTLHLKPGKERSLYRRHPWIFQGSIDMRASERTGAGETVRIVDSEGKFLAVAAFSPQSQIRARVWSFDEATIIDHRFFKNMIRAAAERRAALPIDGTAMRVVHGESDGLPGLIVDRYNNVAVAQFTSAGTERWKDAITQSLVSELKVSAVYERSDSSVRKLEGLEPTQGWLHADPHPLPSPAQAGEGAKPSTLIQFTENSLTFEVDIASGHKTGFYLDQRNNRALFARVVRQAQLKRVLNCYCYTGGFTLSALAGGAEHVMSVDSSAPALAHAARHVQLNDFDAARCEFADADVNATLRKLRAEGQQFDAIVLDPPKFAPSAAHAGRAARAYKDINRLAFHILRPGGFLFTFSCSGGIDPDLFQNIVAGAATDAGCDAAIIERLGAGHDHPHTLAFPEGEYLKGLLLRKLP